MTPKATTKLTSFRPGNTASVGHGAPRGNVNSLRRGIRSEAVRSLKLGQLPDKRVERDCNHFRRLLEEWTLQRHGVITPGYELAINSATRHEIVCRLAVRWLKEHGADLSPTEKLHFLSTMAKHSDLRDKAVDRLRLEQSAADAIATLYGPIDNQPGEP